MIGRLEIKIILKAWLYVSTERKKPPLKGGFVWQTQHNAYHIRGFCRNPKGVPSAKLRRFAPRANLRRFFLPLLCTTKKPPLKGGFVWQTQHNAYHIRGFCRNPKGVPSAKLRRFAPRANLRRFFLPLLCTTKKPPLKGGFVWRAIGDSV